jgi:probable O-glycosylation ligase (exosortase A-associated)
MQTMTDPSSDQSATGRLQTWTMLFRLAVDRPFTGGGFEPYTRWIFQAYLPNFTDAHAAHSIYFQVLGEHGFIGLALFLVFWGLVWRMCSQVVAGTEGRPEEAWALWLAQMIKVSLIAYFVGGAFLNLAYWDMPYYLFVAVAVMRALLSQPKTAPAGLAAPVSAATRAR